MQEIATFHISCGKRKKVKVSTYFIWKIRNEKLGKSKDSAVLYIQKGKVFWILYCFQQLSETFQNICNKHMHAYHLFHFFLLHSFNNYIKGPIQTLFKKTVSWNCWPRFFHQVLFLVPFEVCNRVVSFLNIFLWCCLKKRVDDITGFPKLNFMISKMIFQKFHWFVIWLPCVTDP